MSGVATCHVYFFPCLYLFLNLRHLYIFSSHVQIISILFPSQGLVSHPAPVSSLLILYFLMWPYIYLSSSFSQLVSFEHDSSWLANTCWSNHFNFKFMWYLLIRQDSESKYPLHPQRTMQSRLTSSSISQFFWIIEPRYLKLSLLRIACVSLNLYSK